MTMSEIIAFPGARKKGRGYERKRSIPAYCGRDVILEANDTELIRDVSLNMVRAENKLRKIRERLQFVTEQSAIEMHRLKMADIKLSAAIVAALLSTKGQR
jgi:hypothetical protein